MAGIKIVATDKKGNIKQDYELSRTNSGKVVKINALRDAQLKAKKK